MVLENSSSFLDRLFGKINELGVDISKFDLDHIAYQASSDENYDSIKPTLLKIAELVDENIVGGRRVGLFKLDKPLIYRHYSVPALELVAPKEGQICPSALEHVEFVIDESFDSFMKKYPNLNWDISAVNQPIFPMIKLEIDRHVRVKFHYEPVLEIVRRKKREVI